MKVLITSARDWYGRYERPVSSLSLIIGFVFEWSALKRIDMFWENVWVAAHFFIIAFLIILVNFQEEETTNLPGRQAGHKDASRIHFWYLTFLQGFFGGLLSTFLVFYFRSATLAVSWPFLLLLSAAFVANESFKKHYERVIFQLCLFYLSLLAFSIYSTCVLSPDRAGRIFNKRFNKSRIPAFFCRRRRIFCERKIQKKHKNAHNFRFGPVFCREYFIFFQYYPSDTAVVKRRGSLSLALQEYGGKLCCGVGKYYWQSGFFRAWRGYPSGGGPSCICLQRGIFSVKI